MAQEPLYRAGDRVLLLWEGVNQRGTVQDYRQHTPRGATELVGVADVMLDDGREITTHTTATTLIDRDITARLNGCAPMLLRVMEIVSKELGQCPEGHDQHYLAMLVRATIVKTREE